MLTRILDALASELGEFLERTYGIDGKAVALCQLVDGEGRSAVTGQLALTIVRLQYEPNHGSRTVRPPPGSNRVPICPPLHLNAFVLISTNPDIDYAEGLKLLAGAAAYLNRRARSTPTDSPHLPEGIDDLLLELHELDFEGLSNLWSMLSTGYRPSLLYRLRTVPLVDETSREAAPPLDEIVMDGPG